MLQKTTLLHGLSWEVECCSALKENIEKSSKSQLKYLESSFEGDTQSVMVAVIGIVVDQLRISFKLRGRLQVDMVYPPTIVVRCFHHQLFKTLFLEMSRDKVGLSCKLGFLIHFNLFFWKY